MSRTTPLAVRFERKVDRSGGPDACHIWLGGLGQFGFPAVYVSKGRTSSGRRVAWAIAHEPVPPNRWVTSSCADKRCVNPLHLRLRAAHDDESRFWENVRKAEGDGCWEWTGSLCRRGEYGVFQLRDHSTLRAHRYSWELVHGPIGDPNLFACHRCDNPKCVRPDHLFIGTPKDNHDDCMAKGRHAHGEKHSATMKAVAAKAHAEGRTWGRRPAAAAGER